MAQEPPNPYHLHALDHPGLVLISQPVMEFNYSSWSCSMKIALNSKRKVGFVDESIPKPGDDADPELIANWQCNNVIVFSWLLSCISKDIAESSICANSTATLWKDLHDCFSQANGPRLFQLKEAMVSQQQGFLTVTQYFTRIKSFGKNLLLYAMLRLVIVEEFDLSLSSFRLNMC